MAGKLKETNSENYEVITFDNNKDYKAIKLLSDGKVYVEHKRLADYLVKSKKAEYAKDVELDDVKANTKVVE